MIKHKLDEEKIKYILEKQKHAIERKLTFGIKDLNGDKFISANSSVLEDFYQYFRKNNEPITLTFPNRFTRDLQEFVISGIAEDGISLEYFPLTSKNTEYEPPLIISTPKLFLNAANENEDPEDSSELIKAGLTLLPDVGVKLSDQLSDDSTWKPCGIKRFNNGTTFNMYTDGTTTVNIESYKADIVQSFVQHQPSRGRTYVKQ